MTKGRKAEELLEYMIRDSKSIEPVMPSIAFDGRRIYYANRVVPVWMYRG